MRDDHPDTPPNLDELLSSGGTDPDGFAYSDVIGAYSDDGVSEVRYQFVVRRKFDMASDEEKRPKSIGTPVGPVRPTVRLSEEAQHLVKSADPSNFVDVYVRMRQSLTTPVVPSSGLGFVSLAHAEEQLEKKRASITARKLEAQSLQASFVALLDQMGATEVEGFWGLNAVAARVPVGSLAALSAHPDVERISLPASGTGASLTTWDGDDMKASGGMNTGAYHDQGFTGQAYANNAGGRHMRIAVIGEGFDTDHPGFLDCVGCASRVAAWRCDVGLPGCVPGTYTPQEHATRTAGLAAGSIRQNQIGGYTNQEELERSGVTEEAEPIYLLSIDVDTNHAALAIQFAIEVDVDVIVSSTIFGGGILCNGSGGSDLEEWVYLAQLYGTVFVQAAGNNGDPGSCNLMGLSEAPSAFLVGALAEDSFQCTKNNYSSCPIASYSSRGGMDAIIDGANFYGVLSMIDVLTNGSPRYGFDPDGTINTGIGRGTSWAAPQVGGAGVLVKDWFMDQGYSGAISDQGRLYVVMLAMSDRANAANGYDQVGFHDRWGGGRFQARFPDTVDMGTAFAWTTYSRVLTSTGSAWSEPMWPPGPASTSLNQLKAYAMVFEDNNIDIADVDVYVRTNDCAPGYVTLGSDISRDVKSMVRLGSSARGEDICIRLYAYHMPSGQSRRVHVFAYYSVATGMR